MRDDPVCLRQLLQYIQYVKMPCGKVLSSEFGDALAVPGWFFLSNILVQRHNLPLRVSLPERHVCSSTVRPALLLSVGGSVDADHLPHRLQVRHQGHVQRYGLPPGHLRVVRRQKVLRPVPGRALLQRADCEHHLPRRLLLPGRLVDSRHVPGRVLVPRRLRHLPHVPGRLLLPGRGVDSGGVPGGVRVPVGGPEYLHRQSLPGRHHPGPQRLPPRREPEPPAAGGGRRVGGARRAGNRAGERGGLLGLHAGGPLRVRPRNSLGRRRSQGRRRQGGGAGDKLSL